jgi:hypothetical protein
MTLIKNSIVEDTEIAPTAIPDSTSIVQQEDQVTAPAEKLSHKNIEGNTTSANPGREITQIERQMLLADIGSEKSAKAIRSIADNAIDLFKKTDWTTVDYEATGSVKRRDNIGRMIKVRGTISDLHDPQPRYLKEKDNDDLFDTTQFTLTDRMGESIDSTTIVGQEFHALLQKLRMAGGPVEVLGTVVPVRIITPHGEIKRYSYRLLPCTVIASEDPVQIIQTGNQEMKTVEALVDEMKVKPGGITAYIKSQLVSQIGIKGLEDTPELNRCLDFMILQALSDGYQPERSLSLKLHSLVIGSPGVGKKLLTQSAKILNPVHTEGHASKLTIAGISGTSVYKNQGWHSTPGLIPQAHRGVFIVQDFHSVANKRDIMGVLSMVMEDGHVIDSTSARTTHPALTAIHLDMNRQAQLYEKRKKNDKPLPKQIRAVDLGIALNVLTRFDFIAEIPRDVERQMEIALAMQAGVIRSQSSVAESTLIAQARQLTALVALLRTRFAEIEIPERISAHIVDRQRNLLEMNREKLPDLEILGDFQTRLSNSIVKLIFASARANARHIATLADVETAFHFVRTKLDFLAQIEQFDTPADWDQTQVPEKVQKRRETIVWELSGQEVSVMQAHEMLLKAGFDVTPLTIRRDLEKVAKNVRWGVFQIPGKPNSLTDSVTATPITE